MTRQIFGVQEEDPDFTGTPGTCAEHLLGPVQFAWGLGRREVKVWTELHPPSGHMAMGLALERCGTPAQLPVAIEIELPVEFPLYKLS